MSSRYPHLIVRRVTVNPTPLTPARNVLAIQSALIRGDRVVTLHNTSRILPAQCDKVRIPYEPDDMPQDQPLEWPFGDDEYSGSHNSVTDQPRAVDGYIDLLDWDGFRLEWVKVLGQGGFGMATLWNAIFEDQSSVKVVIKIPTRVNADFDSELDWHLRYGGASHVTQSLNLQEMADNVRRRINRGYMIDRGPRFEQTDLNVLVLEYAERGSLHEMITKASYFGINFSNKVLWEIWECLVKGVVSVALQPDAVKRWGPHSLDKILNSLDNPRNLDEFLRISTLIDSHDVHFDLEEQNILVAEDDQHSHNPIFKLHDFGDFSHRMGECWAHWKEIDYWKVRKCPKRNRTPPETISKEWDKIDLSKPGSVSRFAGETFGPGQNEVAGRYGTWTNIFMIGKIMESVITKNWLGHPMTTMDYTAEDQRCSGPSYGWRLSRPAYGYIDVGLLDLIAQCQFGRPEDRPQLSYLLRNICERKYQGFQESDDETRSFWNDFWARTKTNVASHPTGQPPVPFSQTSTIAASASESQGNDAPGLGQDQNRPLVFTQSFSQGSHVADPSSQLSPSLSRYAQTGNPLITHVATLRRKSRRSLLSVSSEASPPRLSLRPAFIAGQQTAIPDLATNPPPSNPALDSGNQRRWSSSGDASSSRKPPRQPKRSKRNSKSNSPTERTSSAKRISKSQKKVRFFGLPGLTSVVVPGDVMDDSMDDSPGSLNRAWPVVANTPLPMSNIMDADADAAQDLSALYAAIWPERSSVPQSNSGNYFATGSPQPNSGTGTSEALQSQWNTIMGPVITNDTTFTPMEVIPEDRTSLMDLDACEDVDMYEDLAGYEDEDEDDPNDMDEDDPNGMDEQW